MTAMKEETLILTQKHAGLATESGEKSIIGKAPGILTRLVGACQAIDVAAKDVAKYLGNNQALSSTLSMVDFMINVAIGRISKIECNFDAVRVWAPGTDLAGRIPETMVESIDEESVHRAVRVLRMTHRAVEPLLHDNDSRRVSSCQSVDATSPDRSIHEVNDATAENRNELHSDRLKGLIVHALTTKFVVANIQQVWGKGFRYRNSSKGSYAPAELPLLGPLQKCRVLGLIVRGLKARMTFYLVKVKTKDMSQEQLKEFCAELDQFGVDMDTYAANAMEGSFEATSEELAANKPQLPLPYDILPVETPLLLTDVPAGAAPNDLFQVNTPSPEVLTTQINKRSLDNSTTNKAVELVTSPSIKTAMDENNYENEENNENKHASVQKIPRK